tara:strand:+ start:307 stop:678 length:372 start_codon:yes stop_codon:yes gene_type:complete
MKTVHEDILSKIFTIKKVKNHRDVAVAAKVCSWCGTETNKKGFVDELSLKEYNISGFCQSCQDETFRDEPEQLELPFEKPPSYKKDNLKPGEFNPKDIGSDGYEYIEDMDMDYNPSHTNPEDF